MEIRLLAFAGLRDILGEGESTLVIPEGSTVSDVWRTLVERTPGLATSPQPAAAVNQEYKRSDVTLNPGDELAFIPPVSGDEMKRLTDQPIANGSRGTHQAASTH